MCVSGGCGPSFLPPLSSLTFCSGSWPSETSSVSCYINYPLSVPLSVSCFMLSSPLISSNYTYLPLKFYSSFKLLEIHLPANAPGLWALPPRLALTTLFQCFLEGHWPTVFRPCLPLPLLRHLPFWCSLVRSILPCLSVCFLLFTSPIHSPGAA